MKKLITAVSVAVSMLACALVSAHAQSGPQVISPLTSAKWGPAPPLVPPGAQIAVLAGDPSKPVPYTCLLYTSDAADE